MTRREVVITTRPLTAQVTTSRPVVSVTSVGRRGPQGEPGEAGPGGGSYIHTQATPATTWVVEHNLGFTPNVSIVLGDGTAHDGVDVLHIDNDTLTIGLGIALAGKAVCS